MKNIIVLSHTGMLGRYVYQYFKQFPEYFVTGVNRESIGNFTSLNSVGTIAKALYYEITGPDTTIINCCGVVKPQVNKVGETTTVQINSVLPRVFADFCERFGCKFITAVTDCVYSGQKGNYSVHDKKDAEDLYGQSKALGEPKNAINIRSSIIGEEIFNKRSLVEWVKSNDGKTINGFTNHQWNGNTCLEWAKFAKFCIEGNLPYLTYHLTGQSVNKYTLLEQINSTYNLGITIKPVQDSVSIDRTLVSNCQHLYSTPGLREQFEEMKDFGPTLRG